MRSEIEQPVTKFELASARKKAWMTPKIMKIQAGAAENGFSDARQDGVFTTS